MKLGVIGGLGPLATAYFYELLIKMSDVDYDQQHLEVIIHSCPSIPDRTGYILDSTKESPVEKMREIAFSLQDQGVDYIVIPCITAHYFHAELSQGLSVPIIHLVDELGQYLERKKIKDVGIMATTGTISTSFFQHVLSKRRINSYIPYSQDDVMHLIYNNVKAGKTIEMERFNKSAQEIFDQGATHIILGCTELSIVKKEHHLDERYIDAMELLSARALHYCHIPIKKEYQYLIWEE